MKHVAQSMQSNIFYDRDLFLDKVVQLVRAFDVAKHPRSYVQLLLYEKNLVNISLDFWLHWFSWYIQHWKC